MYSKNLILLLKVGFFFGFRAKTRLALTYDITKHERDSKDNSHRLHQHENKNSNETRRVFQYGDGKRDGWPRQMGVTSRIPKLDGEVAESAIHTP